MEIEDYFIFCRAVELLKEAKKKEVDKIMNEYHSIRGISWKLFLGFSIFGSSEVKPKAKRFDESSIEDCYYIAKMYGVTKKQLKPFIEKAREFYEEYHSSTPKVKNDG